MLQSCIYDVAVTNDTSLTSQETLQQGRKNYERDRVNKVKEILVGKEQLQILLTFFIRSFSVSTIKIIHAMHFSSEPFKFEMLLSIS